MPLHCCWGLVDICSLVYAGWFGPLRLQARKIVVFRNPSRRGDLCPRPVAEILEAAACNLRVTSTDKDVRMKNSGKQHRWRHRHPGCAERRYSHQPNDTRRPIAADAWRGI